MKDRNDRGLMKRTAASVATFLAILALSGAASAGPSRPPLSTEGPGICIAVDPRIELTSIVFRLAEAEEYTQCRVASYAADVDKHFGGFKKHPAVALARRLRKSAGISFNAPMSLAVFLRDTVGFAELVPLDPVPAELDPRWTAADARTMIAELRRFARDTDFAAFFEAHAGLYRTGVERMEKQMAEAGIADWLDGFFGRKGPASFLIVLGFLNGNANYGARVRRPDGTMDLYSIVGVWRTDQEGLPVFASRSMTLTVAHEFGHSFANPIIEAHASELEKAGRAIYASVGERMRQQAYGDWRTVFFETLVRASVIRYCADRLGAPAAAEAVESDRERGFLWIGELSDLLAEYETRRDQYATVENFFPRIAAFLTDYSGRIEAEVKKREEEVRRRREEMIAKSPKIVSAVPADGAKDVDPGLKAIVVTFDRPMKDIVAFMEIDPKTDPKYIGKPSFDATGKVLTAPVELQPGRLYEYSLNAAEFLVMQDKEGNVLVPTVIRFRTANRK